MRRLLSLFVLANGLAGAGLPPAPEQPHVRIAQDSCSANCRAQHSQCRIATKGSPSCDAQLQACMQRCIPTRAR